MKWSPF